MSLERIYLKNLFLCLSNSRVLNEFGINGLSAVQDLVSVFLTADRMSNYQVLLDRHLFVAHGTHSFLRTLRYFLLRILFLCSTIM